MVTNDRSRMNQARFDQAAENYFSPALSFFEILGERLIDSLGVSEGERLLDLGCGIGALTMPAASRVGTTGRVIGVDISTGMLRVARRRSREAGHNWTSYHEGDIAHLNLDEEFDYGVCGFVTQMFNDLTTVPRALVRHVRTGGKIGLSVWARGAWEPHGTVFREVLRSTRPDLLPKPGNIQKLQEPGVIESIMADSGISGVEIETIDLMHRLPDFDEYWHLITTLGARPVLEKMDEFEVAELRPKLQSAIAEVGDSDGSVTLSMAALFVRGEVWR
ncbi:MAG: methyltransferase domain-containing protein [Chloroflexi bacterium]|nr:methyltransferase domain-containing protein [Chloroflexota bacterium]